MNRSLESVFLVGVALAILVAPARALDLGREARQQLTRAWDEAPPIPRGEPGECRMLWDHPGYTHDPVELEEVATRSLQIHLWPDEYERLMSFRYRMATMWRARALSCPPEPEPPELELERSPEADASVEPPHHDASPVDVLGF